MGLSEIKSYFKLYDMADLTPEERFKNAKGPQYFWHGCESEANSRRTTPTPSRAASRRPSLDHGDKKVSATHVAMRSAYGI